MGWGGARPGAGRKSRVRKPVGGDLTPGLPPRPGIKPRAQTRPQQVESPAIVKARADGMNQASIDTMLMVAEMSKQLRKPKDESKNPFKLPDFPPKALPPQDKRMAMDDSLSWAGTQWSGMQLGEIANEGLLFLGYPYLSELAQRPEYRVMSETIATEMTRKWITLQGTGENDKTEQIRELSDFLDHLQVRDKYAEVALHDGLFGRSHLFHDFGADDHELKTPIGNGRDAVTKAKVKKGSLKALRTIEPVWVYPTTYNAVNPLAADWYNPQVWYVMGQEIHCSRLSTFVGREVPDLLKPAYSFGGLSLTQLAKPYVDIWLTTRESVGALIHSFSVMVLMTDLQTILQPGNAANLMARIAMFNALRDNQGAFVINEKTEDFKNVSASLSGLHELQAQSQEHMMSVARIPAVKFTGIQPTGLNASSEGEMRAFYDTIAAFQNKLFRPKLQTTIDFAMISLWGKRDPDITFAFEPLWELSEKEKSEKRKADAETDTILIDGGVISPEEARTRIANDPESGYQGLDPDDVPEPPAPEGGEGGPGGLPPPGGEPDDIDAEQDAQQEKNAQDERAAPFVDDGVDCFAADADWNESDHPRAQNGQFGSGGGGASPGKGAKGGKGEKSAAGAKTSPAGALNPSSLKKVGNQMGSNPGGVYEAPGGERFYVKKGRSEAHVKNELLAASLYQLAGAPTLNYRPVEGGGHVATEMQKLDKSRLHEFTPAEIKAVQENFAAHAWLSNWDAAGTGGDNQGMIKGVPTTLDVGGALEFRAQGEPKGKAFGNEVAEFDSLRNPQISPDAARVFGKMTPEQIKASIKKVAEISDNAIRNAVADAGVGEEMATKLIERKRDLAKKVGMQALDEGKFEESKHPRSPDGKFTSGAGGGSTSPSEGEGKGKEGEKSESKKMDYGGLWTFKDDPSEEFKVNALKIANTPVKTGNFWRNMVRRLIKDNANFGGENKDNIEKVLKDRLAKSFMLSAEKLYKKAAGLTDEKEIKELNDLAAKAEAQAKKYVPNMAAPAPVNPKKGQMKPAPEGKAPFHWKGPNTYENFKKLIVEHQHDKSVIDGLMVHNPEFAKQLVEEVAKKSKLDVPITKATPDELKKAAKSTPVSGVLSSQTLEGQKAIQEFDKKYSGKEITDPTALNQKVADYKALQATVAAENAKAQAEAQAKAKAAAEAQKAKEAAEAKANAAKNKQVMKDLGINEQEAEGFGALVKMLGGTTSDVVESFKQYASKAEKYGYPISGFQAALISNYSNGGYSKINADLRKGSWSVAQHVYVKMVNQALRKMPTYKGTVTRNTTLSADQQALYVAGNVVEERAFTSSSTGSVFSGNTQFKITAIGKRGASIQKLSNHPSENEVLFAARTFFKVTKVETHGTQRIVHMEEMDD